MNETRTATGSTDERYREDVEMVGAAAAAIAGVVV
jgi:hypothetical protein